MTAAADRGDLSKARLNFSGEAARSGTPKREAYLGLPSSGPRPNRSPNLDVGPAESGYLVGVEALVR